ncbi:peptidyl-glycine alpha-amidating monooxygenase isoform X3 [Synchiropus splendidus]|uniref:peptidyl-glycine alpha-amidating monooxygenase isoform X3 n=1 Tax=Synchiropus splendidus TaxID=270530 RepID=UPI00237D570C|nr:peptidyl-glycine alpha-amidating monooxygenase isoform X3 [Synchiropus splendidus]
MALPVGSLLLLLGLFSHSYAAETIDPLFRVKRSQETYASEPGACSSTTKQQDVTDSSNFSVDIRMPGVVPAASDTYLCMSYPVPTTRDSYIVDFKPQASMKTVHHMLLFGCKSPYSKSGYWDCGTAHGTCRDEASIMYAWARNAPPTKLPKDVGFKVGRNSGMTYFVLQMHYGDVSSFRDHHRDCSGLTLTMTTKPQPFIAGIYLLMTMDTVILPGKRVTNADVACDYSSDPIYPFAFRTHTHRLGKVVSGYRIRDGKWTLIGRQSPQLPQAFYPANKDATIKNGDTVAARCVFTGEGRTTITKIGGTSEDEMCNFYIMYYMDNKHAIPYMDCMEDGSPKLFQRIPAEANTPIAVNPGEMNSMMHMGHNADKPAVDTSGTEQDLSQDNHLEQDTSWPQSSLQLGQVSGLALDSDSNLVIFHRGEHEWGPNSFNNDARYMQKSLGPIQQSTILVVNPDDGSILKASGRNLFFLPHGITTDMDNNYWVTDVALHQVLKVSSDGRDRILLTLGEAFTPGTDHNHFCKPTDVAVDPHTGSIFVSDGYCNARILKYSPKGKYLSEWGAGSTDRRRRVPFSIPHSLAFLPDRKEVCVADRENGRIQCFNAETGEFVKEIKKEEFGGEVYAISYSPSDDGVIYAVNGESLDGPSAPIQGFAINYSTKDILDTFRPESKEFKMPHDIVQTKDASVFVGDVDSKFVFKFTTEKSHRSVKKAGIEVLEVATIIKTKLIPGPNESKPVAIKEKQILVQQPEAHTEPPELKKEKKLDESQGALPVVITTLLLVPLVLVIALGVFICWRKNNRYEVKSDPTSVGGILGKIRGKAVGSLNLGNFFATHKGYTRQGFDQLSTEGSDQERNEDESSESENEEYSALPPPRTSP